MVRIPETGANAWIDKPRLNPKAAGTALAATRLHQEGSTVIGRILAFEDGGARVEYPAGAPEAEGWGPTDGGISAIGAQVRVLIGADGRIMMISAPDSLPDEATQVATGATGKAALDAAAMSDEARAAAATAHAEAMAAQQDLTVAAEYIENTVIPGITDAQARADEALAEGTAAAADAFTAHQQAMTAQTTAATAQAAAGTAHTAATAAALAAADAQQAADDADTQALAALTAAGTAQTTANAKGRVIRQESAPTGSNANGNNLWIKTSTGQPYTYVDGSWTLVTDTRITSAADTADTAANAAANAIHQAGLAATAAAAAQSTANTAVSDAAAANSEALAAKSSAAAAQSRADSAHANAVTAQGTADAAGTAALEAAGIANAKGRVIFQASAPTGANANAVNLWIRTSDNRPHTYNGSSWVAVTDKAATDAASAAASAQTTANTAVSNAQAAQTTANAAAAAAAGAQATADAASNLASTADGRYTVAAGNPTAANAAGKPLGAVWEVRSGGSALRRYVLTGATTWTQVRAGQDFIGEGAIGAAQIGDAAIGTAHIGDEVVTTSKIGSLTVDKLRSTGGAEFQSAVVQTLMGQTAFVDALYSKRGLFGDFTNYWFDQDYRSGQYGSRWVRDGTGVKATGNGTQHGLYALDSVIAVTPGDQFSFSAVRANIVGSAGTVNLSAQRSGDAGVTWISWGNMLSLASAGQASASATVPAGTTHIRFGLYLATNVSASTTVRISDIQIRRKTGSVLIENGAIVADHVTATAELWAKVLAVAGNATIGGDLLANGAVTSRLLNVVSEVGGRFLSIKPDGVRIWDDSSSEDSPLISLAAGSENFFATTDGVGAVLSSIDSEGGVTGVSVAARESLTYRGAELSEILWDMPRGVVAYGSRTMASNIPNSGRVGIGALTFVPEEGRMYRVHAQGPSYASAGAVSLQMIWAGNGGTPLDGGAVDTAGLAFAGSSNNNATLRATRLVAAGQIVEGGQVLTPGQPATVFFVAGSSNAAATVSAAYKTFIASIEDVGSVRRIASQGATWVSRDLAVSPPPPVATKTVSFDPSASGTYLGSGEAYAYMGSQVTQGVSPARPGAMRGIWVYPSLQSTLAGATVHSVEIWLQNNHAYRNVGLTAHLFVHGYGSLPATLVGSQSVVKSVTMKKGEGRWVDVTAESAAILKSGACRGFGVYATSQSDYGYFAGAAPLRVKYTK